MKLRIFLVLLVLAAQLGAIFHFTREREREAAEAPRIRLACEIPQARHLPPHDGGIFGTAVPLSFGIARAIPFEKFDEAAQATLRAKLSPLVAERLKNPTAAAPAENPAENATADAKKCGVPANAKPPFPPRGALPCCRAKNPGALGETDVWLVLKTNAETGLSEIDCATFTEPKSLAAGTTVLRTKLTNFEFGEGTGTPANSAANGVPANAAGIAAALPEPPPESPEDVAEKTFGFVPGDSPDEAAATGVAAEIDLSVPAENSAENPAAAASAAVPAEPAESVPATAAGAIYETMKFSVCAERSRALVSGKIARKIAELGKKTEVPANAENSADAESAPAVPAAFSAEIYQRADGSICVVRIFADGEEIR